MSPNWAPKRIEIRQKDTPFYHGQFSAVAKYGTGTLYDKIKKYIEKLNGKIFFNHALTGLKTDGNKIIELKFNI
jgi:phytoene dehydrogenase-like protein